MIGKSTPRFPRRLWQMLFVFAISVWAAPLHSSLAASPLSARLQLADPMISPGGMTTLTIEVTGSAAGRSRVDRLPHIDGLLLSELSGRSTSSSVNIVNGRMTTSKTSTFTVRITGMKEGSYVLGPFAIFAGTEETQTDTISLQVAPVREPQEFVQLAFSPARAAIYIGEPLQIDVTVSIRKPFVERQINDSAVISLPTWSPSAGLEALALPAIQDDGRSSDILTIPTETGGKISLKKRPDDGGDFDRYKVTLLYKASSIGRYTFKGARYATTVATKVRRVREFFDERLVASETKSALATTPGFDVEVRALPAEGRPKDFSGLIGDFKQEVRIDRRALAVGESLKLVREISGTGNLSLMEPPPVTLPSSFKVFGSLVERDNNSITQTVDVAPRDTSVTEIPAIPLHFFDVRTGRYARVESDAIPIRVEGSSGDALPELADALRPSGDDLRGLKPTGVVRPQSPTPLGPTLPIALGFLTLGASLIRQKREANPLRARCARASRAFNAAIERMRTENVSDVPPQLATALVSLLSDLTGHPPGRFTDSADSSLLTECSEATRIELTAVREALDQIRFAGQGSMNNSQLLERVEKLGETLLKEYAP